ncbi:MAG: hypothetical protein Q9162_001494 [Coniocarpon cinnabarinum]
MNGVVRDTHLAHKSDAYPCLLQNHGSRPWVVQKYGGTAVGKFPQAIVQNVKDELKGHSGTTTRLIKAAHEAENPESRAFEGIIKTIRDDHIEAARKYFANRESPQSNTVFNRFTQRVDDECQDLIGFLLAAQRVGEISVKSKNTIVSKGEILSCHFLIAILEHEGIDVELVDLSNIVPVKTDPFSVKAPEGVGQDFYDAVAEAIRVRIKECGPRIPVVTGYFGIVSGGLLDQVGRGYTDLCAALVAVGVQATELQIWKEVDGIFSADPRRVPTSKLLTTITPAEAAELTFYGSEVIHPFTMHQAVSSRIPLRIRNVNNSTGPGTKIVPDLTTSYNVDGSPGHRPNGSLSFRPRSSCGKPMSLRAKRPTAVTIKNNILVMNVHSNKRSLSHGFFAKIFSILDKWKLSVDLISTSEVHVSMALHSESAFVDGKDTNKRVVDEDLKRALDEIKLVGDVDLLDDMAILSLVGREMKNMIGIAGRMFSVLGENHVNIEMISQGASEINISCVIENRDADRAMSILHTNLFTFLDDAPS